MSSELVHNAVLIFIQIQALVMGAQGGGTPLWDPPKGLNNRAKGQSSAPRTEAGAAQGQSQALGWGEGTDPKLILCGEGC